MNPLSIQKLSDSDLVSELRSSVSDERKRTAIILEFLREVDRRKLYAEHGYASLWEFCVKELGYSKGSASRRVNSMRLLREIPELKEDIILGKFNLTTLSQAQNFFNLEEKHSGEKLSSEDKSEVLSKLEGKSETECELELIRMSSVPMEISNPEKERIINDEYTEWKILIDAELHEMLDRIRALRSHAQPAMTKAELLKYMAKEILKRLDPIEKEKRIKPIKEEVSSSAPDVTTSQFKRVPIPAKTKRLIWTQAQGVCRYQDTKTGKACGSRYFLEIDHLKPVALGGSNDPNNLRLLCRAHNSRASIKILGIFDPDTLQN